MNELEKARKIFELSYLFKQDNRNHCGKEEQMMHREMMILHWMQYCHREGYVKMNDIADNFHITPAAVSQIMRNFEKKGWVERIVLDHDRRSVYMKVTEEAIRLMEKTEAYVHQRLAEFLKYLGEEDSDALIRIMEKATSYGKIL